MAKLGNNPTAAKVRTKEYRIAVRHVLDSEMQPGDRDKFATAARIFFQDDRHVEHRRALRSYLKPQAEEEE